MSSSNRISANASTTLAASSASGRRATRMATTISVAKSTPSARVANPSIRRGPPMNSNQPMAGPNTSGHGMPKPAT